MKPVTKLRIIKITHTMFWALFAGCILAIPVFLYLGQRSTASILIGIVLFEVLILALNKMRCPLTDLASNYTTEQPIGFDIYLPPWLAKHNKTIFGVIFVIDLIYAWVVSQF